jgi:hypothetical protein
MTFSACHSLEHFIKRPAIKKSPFNPFAKAHKNEYTIIKLFERGIISSKKNYSHRKLFSITFAIKCCNGCKAVGN